MLTSLRVRNFKRFVDVEIELGNVVVFVGPNNSGKTAALQALALWEIGLRRWQERRAGKAAPESRPGVAINRRDLIAIPVPNANLLWKDLHVRDVRRVEGRTATKNVRIDIIVTGITNGKQWECGLEFDYANEESFYCRPLRLTEGRRPSRMRIPPEANGVRVAFLPPMSGLAANETRLDPGAISVRIGEGRTAEVLRNLCYQVSEDTASWESFAEHARSLFGVGLDPPHYVPERGEVAMTYRELGSGTRLDLSSSGRGLQQTMLLLAHLYTNRDTVLLLDEPDAHLEILRQRQTYQVLTDIAGSQGSQIIIASHSEVILNEGADRDVVVAFVGRPHRIDDRGSQVLKALKEIGFEQYYQAEQTGWVLYLEGSTDLAILRALARTLEHPAQEVLEQPFVRYVSNQPRRAREHFYGLREAKGDLGGVALFDRLDRPLREGEALVEMAWQKREIENYLCCRQVLLDYAASTGAESSAGPLFEAQEAERRRAAMLESIAELERAQEITGRPAPFSDDAKASDDFLDPLFRNYYRRLGLPDLMQKTDYHVLAALMPAEAIAQEVGDKLDAILAVARAAKPTEG